MKLFIDFGAAAFRKIRGITQKITQTLTPHFSAKPATSPKKQNHKTPPSI